MLRFKLSWIKWLLVGVILLVLYVHFVLFVQKLTDKTGEENSNKISSSRSSVNHHRITDNDKNIVLNADSFIVYNASELPGFARDYSEYIFSSLIEREFDSNNLYVTTLMLSHFMLQPNKGTSGCDKVNPSAADYWHHAREEFQHTEYTVSGVRDNTIIVCRIYNDADSTSFYTVKAQFIPNKVTSDSNSNRRLDIIRCPMQNTQHIFENLIGTNHNVKVELMRRVNTDYVGLKQFNIPWNTRRTGYLLSNFTDSSKLDPWKGATFLKKSPPRSLAVRNKIDNTHVCVYGIRRLPTKQFLPIVIEFVSHHLLLGAEHIYLPFLLLPDSKYMKQILQIFKSYIDEGRLTILSQAPEIDLVASVSGMKWQRTTLKVFQATTCLYLAKGVAEFITFHDIDEFFMPAGDHRTFHDVFNAIEAKALQSPTSGYANLDMHPYCHLIVSSNVIVDQRGGSSSVDNYDPFLPWMGHRFGHSPEPSNSQIHKQSGYTKVIVPTNRIYLIGLNAPGACLLSKEWTSCKNISGKNDHFCESDSFRSPININGKWLTYNNHDFNEVVASKDGLMLNNETDATFFHFLIYHPDTTASYKALTENGRYKKTFFDNILLDIRSRGLETYVTIEEEGDVVSSRVDNFWPSMFDPNELSSAAHNAIEPSKQQFDFKLPNNFRHRDAGKEVSLPNFAYDYSDFILSSMIERVSDSYELYLTTFFMCHMLVEPKIGASAQSGEAISPEVINIWKHIMNTYPKTAYNKPGIREANFMCKITNSIDDVNSVAYMVPGKFVGTRLTPDSNSNRRLDILRCPMRDTEFAYMNYARSQNHHVFVEILRDGSSVPIIKFKVPWSSRTNGYLLDLPRPATTIDPWKGFDKFNPGKWSHDTLHLCVPGMESALTRQSLPLYLEFVQYHLLLGVNHIFIAASYTWDSQDMEILLRVMKKYIDEGKVSITTQTADNVHLSYTAGGVRWGRDNVKNFHVNMCLYYNKGVSDYVGVWDYDEHFIPLGNYESITDIIKDVDFPPNEVLSMNKDSKNKYGGHEIPVPSFHAADAYNGGRGLADKDGHPLCYMVLSSQVTFFKKAVEYADFEHPWIGERFSHGAETLTNGSGLGFQKSIRPTRRIFQGGLHLGGACHLPYPWNGCSSPSESFCESGFIHRLQSNINGSVLNFHNDQLFDEVVYDEDAKHINPLTQGVINHIQFHRHWFGATSEALDRTSFYTSKYFTTVVELLDRQGLYLPMSLPVREKVEYVDVDDNWLDFSSFYDMAVDRKSHLRTEEESEAEHFSLPNFAYDFSEYFVGSVLERASNSYDLFITTFLLSHESLLPDKKGEFKAHKIKNTASVTKKWAHLIKSIQQSRTGSTYFCKIRNRHDQKSYSAPAVLIVPNENSVDTIMDIVRCKVFNGQDIYRNLDKYIQDNEMISIEIVRKIQSKESTLIKFSIPYATRIQGKTLESTVKASSYNPWKGYIKGKDPSEWTNDRINMCVPGIESTPSLQSLPLLLEFVQHHLLMGVSHIFLSTQFNWDSTPMSHLISALRGFIQDSFLTITSHTAIDNEDRIYSMHGVSWSRNIIKIYQINMCFYYNKGIADFVGLWDVDEFFIPKGGSKNLLDMLDSTEETDSKKLQPIDLNNPETDAWSVSHRPGKRGYASAHAHPYCYIQISSDVVANKVDLSSLNNEALWIGNRFRHDVEQRSSEIAHRYSSNKHIIPTRTIHNIGSLFPGSCKLASGWNGCEEEYCYTSKKIATNVFEPVSMTLQGKENRLGLSEDQGASLIKVNHKFDENVTADDAYIIDKDRGGVLYHFMVFRHYKSEHHEEKLISSINDYALLHFNNTMNALRSRNLDLLITLPYFEVKKSYPDSVWEDYDEVWANKNTVTGN